jgi:aminoglycoside phosphotransferase family enzyme
VVVDDVGVLALALKLADDRLTKVATAFTTTLRISSGLNKAIEILNFEYLQRCARNLVRAKAVPLLLGIQSIHKQVIL